MWIDKKFEETSVETKIGEEVSTERREEFREEKYGRRIAVRGENGMFMING
jgi:hypothetical protein